MISTASLVGLRFLGMVIPPDACRGAGLGYQPLARHCATLRDTARQFASPLRALMTDSSRFFAWSSVGLPGLDRLYTVAPKGGRTDHPEKTSSPRPVVVGRD